MKIHPVIKGFIILLSGIALGGTLIWLSTSYVLIPNHPPDISNSGVDGEIITYADFITILLTAVTVFLAIMAVMIGMAAAISLKSLKDQTVKELKEDAQKMEEKEIEGSSRITRKKD